MGAMRLRVPGGGCWEWAIAGLVVYALVPPICLRWVGWSTEANWLLSLCTRFGPWDSGLRLCIDCMLLLVVFRIVVVSGWRDNDS